MSKKSRFRGPFEKQHGKRAQTLLKYASHHFYHIHWSLPSQLSSKNSFLLRCQILGLLDKTFAEKCPVHNRGNLTIPIPVQLSEKEKFFLNFWTNFPNAV